MKAERESGGRTDQRSERREATDAGESERSMQSRLESRFEVARLEWVAHRENADDVVLGYCSEPMS